MESNAAAIIVSSIYGYGELDCQGMREKCNEYGLKDILLYVGGNIGTGNEDWESIEKRFKKIGFDRIYKPGTSIEKTIEDLKLDLEEKKLFDRRRKNDRGIFGDRLWKYIYQINSYKFKR